MTGPQWKSGRTNARLTQVEAARALGVSQPYLSQLEKGLRLASEKLSRKAAGLYKLPPTTLPLPGRHLRDVSPDDLQRRLAALGYPGFEHLRAPAVSNPAETVLDVVLKRDLDTRLVEAVPWVLNAYTDLDWVWLRDHAKLSNAQNRLGYLVHLADQVPGATRDKHRALAAWERDIEKARLAAEGTLCRDSMPEPERAWLRTNRPEAAAHWNLLTSLSVDQLPYADR